MEQLLPAQIDAFLAMLQQERGRSANTIAAYRNDLTQFSTFVQADSPGDGALGEDGARSLDAALVGRWRQTLAEKDFAPATVARKQAAVFSFCQWLGVQTTPSSPDRETGSPPARAVSAAPAIDADAVEALLAYGADSRTPQALRDNALMQLMVGLGLTASKIVALDVEHLRPEGATATLRVDSVVRKLPAQVAAVLSIYVSEGREHLAAHIEEGALFLNHRGKRLTRQGLWLIVKRRAKDAGVAVEVTPQSLRQAFALRQIEKGIAPKNYAEQMGTSPRRSAQDYRRMAKRAKTTSITIDGKPFEP